MKIVLESLKMLLWMTVLTGLIYPLVITGIAQVFFHEKASGSFLEIEGKPRGSALIAQKFSSDRYFWPRPSAGDYNALSSGGSNLGPTSAELKKQVNERRQAIGSTQVPDELLFASGSGLDPHISVETAYFQINRIAKARSIKPEEIKQAIDEATTQPSLRFFGKPKVNVLLLNHHLDQLDQATGHHG